MLSLMRMPPPKLLSSPVIIVFPFFPPMVQGELDIMKALLVRIFDLVLQQLYILSEYKGFYQ